MTILFYVCTVLLFVGGAVTATWFVSSYRRGKHVDTLLVDWTRRIRK